jgi:7-cyano-7-deazaguanine synthase in queuosine biosynthesis
MAWGMREIFKKSKEVAYNMKKQQLVENGKRLFKLKKYKESIKCYNLAIKIDSKC